MRTQCTEDQPLWTRPFAARYLGVSTETVAKLMHEGTLRYCYPFPGNDRDCRLFREDIIGLRQRMLDRATIVATAQRRGSTSGRSTAAGDTLAECAASLRQVSRMIRTTTEPTW